MKNPILIILAVGACQLASHSQTAFEFSSTVGLGYSELATPSPIVRLNDSLAVIVSPSHTVDHRETVPRLMVISDFHQGGALNQIFYYFFNPENPGIVFNKPVRLNDTTVCLFSEGPDGVPGTQDDGVNYIPNVDLPFYSQPVFHSLGQPGPRPDDEIHRLGDNWVAWLHRGNDGTWDTGDESVRWLRMDGTSFIYITVPFSASQGQCDGYTVDMGDGAFGARLTGADRTLGTDDDEVAMISTTPGGSSPRLTFYAAGSGIQAPQLSPDWPKYAGNGTLVYPNGGEDGMLGNEDDQLIVIQGMDSTTTHESRPVMGHRLWNQWIGPVTMGVEPDGTLAFFSMGNDGWLGSPDDGLLWVSQTAAGASGDGNENLGLGQYLIWEFEENVLDTVTLPCGTTVCRTYGSDPRIEEHHGVLVVQKSAAGRRVQHIPFGEGVTEFVPLGDSAVLLYMGSGVVYLLSGLGGDSMAVRPVPGLMAPTSGMTQTISPSVVMATRYQAPNVINMANDVIQLYIVPSAFNYGASTESTSAYAMHSGVEDRLPQTGNMPYFVTLESAPPANPAWLMLSWQRSSLYILPDVEFLLDQEQFIGVYSWYTSYDGTAALPMPVPSDPDLTGFAWHAQWLVLDADQPRGFQLSDGLTIAF